RGEMADLLLGGLLVPGGWIVLDQADVPAPQEQVAGDHRAAGTHEQQHRRPGVLVREQPVDAAHDETERRHVGPEPHRTLHGPGPGPGTVMCVSWTTLGSSLCRQSNVGRSERIGASHSKLCSDGGEEVIDYS